MISKPLLIAACRQSLYKMQPPTKQMKTPSTSFRLKQLQPTMHLQPLHLHRRQYVLL